MENSTRCILLYVGLCFLKVPLTASYNFDSGTAFYNLIVGPHKSVICVDSFQISGEIGYTSLCLSEREAVGEE